MKVAILYASVHHQNTKKLVDAIKKEHPEVDCFDTTKVIMKDLISYDLIGIASGIYFGKFHKSVIPFLYQNLPENKKTFLMYTCGAMKDFGAEVKEVIAQRKCQIEGIYTCMGYDTFGPFKLVGGLNKNHPDNSEVAGAVEFFERLIQ